MEVTELKAALSNTGIFRHCFRAETEIWRAETERLDTYPAFRITRGIRSKEICISILRFRRMVSIRMINSIEYRNGLLTMWIGNEAHIWRLA